MEKVQAFACAFRKIPRGLFPPFFFFLDPPLPLSYPGVMVMVMVIVFRKNRNPPAERTQRVLRYKALDQQRCPCCLSSHVEIFTMARMVVHLYL